MTSIRRALEQIEQLYWHFGLINNDERAFMAVYLVPPLISKRIDAYDKDRYK